MAIWDDIYNIIAGVYDAVTGGIAQGIDTVIKLLAGILAGIAELITTALGGIADIVTYPIISIGGAILDVIGHLITPFIGLFWNITDTGIYIASTITGTLGLVFDAVWMTLILAGVGFVVLVRLYHFAKDIEIAGFKV